ncbi:hypothetical protein CCHR01_02533 [Colletotrichum chrysophilum]|uniref:Zn(2)-C6 fungal-type domain-containing protein n=1 Tax=Colletotrichum chrysophilum TaxID=1836956 RepID=A0AAD9ENJ3_9PEZI|nr:hypothetical protein CCHR01_02533 [Colletotrichum chrysophilum]
MARRKRKYVPKVKGCYECSQRRIDCDGTKPSCFKCTTRGIQCSGFGLQYKFLDGFSRRARPQSLGNRSALLKDALAQSSKSTSSRLRYHNCHATTSEHEKPHDSWEAIYWESSTLDIYDTAQQDALIDACLQTSPRMNDEGSDPEVPNSSAVEEKDVAENASSSTTTEVEAVVRPRKPAMLASLSILEPWKEFLIAHFSESIAPEMVVIDDCFNGWRHLVLPLAWTNEMIMDSVLAVSAFHIAGKAASQAELDPYRLYTRAIHQLLNRKDLVDWDKETRQFVILAIMVLLVSVMVNGLSDFPIVFQMLESAIDAVGGEDVIKDGAEMGGFLLRQIHKMRVYAAPLLSQEAGVDAIMYHGKESFDCLYYYHSLYPDYCSTFDHLADLRQQAFSIYLNRALGDSIMRESSAELINSYQKGLESLPDGSVGEHCLVWPTFIAALECRNHKQQSFFEQFLLRQYHRNQFSNILKALELLRSIWDQTGRGSETNWPALIPSMRVFIM